MGQLELERRIVILEKVSSIIDTKKFDKANSPPPLVVPQPDYFDIIGTEDLGIWRDACEAVEKVILGRVIRQSLDDDGRRRTAGRISARGPRARAEATVTLSIVGQFVVVGESDIVVWS